MSVPVMYHVACEDLDFRQDSAFSVSGQNASFCRIAYARCGLGVTTGRLEPMNQFGPMSTFWFTCRYVAGANSNLNNGHFFDFMDSSRVVRLSLQGTGTNSQYQMKKINAAGSATNLGSPFSMTLGINTPNKIDWFIDDQVSGTINLYFNGLLMFSFSGDTTTDGVNSLATYNLWGNAQNAGVTGYYSECALFDSDSRSASIQTLAPVANGNTHNFDTGSPAAANVNETSINDATLDGSTTAGQIDQYTIPAIAAGTYTIAAIAISARMQKGSSGPSKADLNVRSGGADNFSSDLSLITTWADYLNIWATDPATGVTWAALPTNIGIKSVT